MDWKGQVSDKKEVILEGDRLYVVETTKRPIMSMPVINKYVLAAVREHFKDKDLIVEPELIRAAYQEMFDNNKSTDRDFPTDWDEQKAIIREIERRKNETLTP